MIPIQMMPVPSDFDNKVRRFGQAFLSSNPKPTSSQWHRKDYWRYALMDLRTAYHETCAYCAQWIPYSTGAHTVDHFIPKSQQSTLAYEWSNFRYASSRFNGRKGTQEILDPFQLEYGWFTLDFITFLIKPSRSIDPNLKIKIKHTIDVLKLNTDQRLVNERREWYSRYIDSRVSFEYLVSIAPFIAYELERQGFASSPFRTPQEK